MGTTTLIAANEEVFLKKAALTILEAAAQAVARSKQFTLVLSGGSTPAKLYALLADPYYRDRMPWAQTYIFFGDERCVPPEHADSNFKMAQEALFSKVSLLPQDHIFRMKGEMESPQEAAKDYESAIKAFFKIDKSLPQFDLILLGLGEDGHTASLFPGTESLKEKLKWVVGHHVPQLSTNRITLTFPVINHARRVLFLVAGPGKSTMTKEILRGDDIGIRFPAELVKPEKGELIWLLDRTAAAKLPSTVLQKASHL